MIPITKPTDLYKLLIVFKFTAILAESNNRHRNVLGVRLVTYF